MFLDVSNASKAWLNVGAKSIGDIYVTMLARLFRVACSDVGERTQQIEVYATMRHKDYVHE